MRFFQTKALPGFGRLQDGGVRANNPLAIALKESAMIWPTAKKHDLLLSVGTGFSLPTPGAVTGSRGMFRDGPLPRLVRATLSSPCMDGEQGFYEALNYLPNTRKPDIIRLNHAINGSLPRLDDISSLATMSTLRFTVPDELVRALLASAFFFFELDSMPVKKHGEFLCQGSILCPREKVETILERVLAEIPGARFQTASGYQLGEIYGSDGCYSCGYYRKGVKFSVKSLEEMMSIEIANSNFAHKIGGFPKSAQELLVDQQAHARFGRADHQVALWPPNRVCYCSRGKKRRIQFSEPRLGQKRPRL